MIDALIIGLHLVSAHVPAYDYQNNLNPGVYARFENGLTIGAYHNTYKRASIYAGYTAEHNQFALTTGLITGYKYHKTTGGYSKSTITLMLAPSVRLGTWDGYSPRLSIIPKIGKLTDSNAIHLSIEHSFKGF